MIICANAPNSSINGSLCTAPEILFTLASPNPLHYWSTLTLIMHLFVLCGNIWCSAVKAYELLHSALKLLLCDSCMKCTDGQFSLYLQCRYAKR